MPYRMTKSERIARRNWARDSWVLEQMELPWDLPDRLPAEWKLIAHDMDVTERKVKVTLYLDRSVARMFRELGQGYQGVINRVLRVWLQCKAAGWMDDELTILKGRQVNIMRKQMMSGLSYREYPGWDESLEEWAEARMPEG